MNARLNRRQQPVGRIGIAVTVKKPGDLVLTSRGVVRVQLMGDRK